MVSHRIGVLIGSLSTESINRRLFTALRKLAPTTELELHEIPLNGLPLYNRDLDYALPSSVQEFKTAVTEADGLIIITPEYNRSIPAALKNALEWVSRPYGDNAAAGKPSAVIGGSIGAVGTAIAQQHLHSILASLGAPELHGPEVFLQIRTGLIDDDGTITDDSTAEFLLTWLGALHTHVSRALTPVPVS